MSEKNNLPEINELITQANRLEFEKKQIQNAIGSLMNQPEKKVLKIIIEDQDLVFHMKDSYLMVILENYIPNLDQDQKEILKKIKSI